MQFMLINDPAQMEALADEWNALLKDSASHVPFLRNEYLATWWKTRGGGEWTDGELAVVIARSVDGALLGIAPMFFTPNRQGQPALMLLGSIEISDYLDVIVRPDDLATFLDGLVEFLVQLPAPDWKVLDWYNLLDSSPTLPVIKEIAERRGCSFEQEQLQHCPYIPLPGDWETYLASMDKKQRHEIRRKMRRAEMNEDPVRWYFVEDGAKLDSEVDAFLDLMANDPEKKNFLTPAMREQMHAGAQAAFNAGWLQLSFIEVDGQKAAGYMNFDYLNQIWVYNSGMNNTYRELSLGWVLLGNLLQWSIEHGRQVFDFMRGDEDYKYRFGAVDRHVERIVIGR